MSMIDGGPPTPWETHRLKMLGTRGTKKIFNYILELSDQSDFKKDVEAFRVKFGIPKTGFRADEEYVMCEDVQVHPLRWERHIEDKSDAFWDSYSEDQKALMEKYSIPFGGGIIVEGYAMYNHVGLPFFTGSLCHTQSIEDFFERIEEGDVDTDYPVMLQISPYATLRDILDYVKATYTQEIKPIQKRYSNDTVRLGKARSKNDAVQKRNQFIYEHRDLPLKDLRKLLAKEKVFLDDGHISKVISLERKRRKEV